MSMMFLGNPELELRIYGEDYQDVYNYNYVDRNGNEYEYDQFIGKWLKKRRERRSKNPKVIARRKKQAERRIAKGKGPKYPRTTTGKTRAAEPSIKPSVEKKTVVPDIIPLTKTEAQAHKNVNKAIQEELKTKQEELKTLGLEKKVAQEDIKAEQIKGQVQMASTGKGLLWVVAIVGGIWVVSKVVGRSPARQPLATA